MTYFDPRLLDPANESAGSTPQPERHSRRVTPHPDDAAIFGAMLGARDHAGVSLAQLAERMGVDTANILHMENRIAAGRPVPLRVLRQYAAAGGKRLVISFE
ncbi:ribosome-binding protein aMBF1 (putative translation factor) [Paraburkholderia sp. GAS448]|uniref:helix-turn-helix domain-containing protein n=1 Tax=Paraburkholderia sp. GAS448 TaxID=3035136 RepID=UPI003D1C7206